MAQPREAGVFPFEIIKQADAISVSPNDLVAAIIGRAIFEPRPRVRSGEWFVVLGVDGMDGTLFPYSSFKTVEEAKAYIIELEESQDGLQAKYELPSEQEGGVPLDRFYLFTRDGHMVSLRDCAAA
jgi:hypothetical protein